MTTELDFNSCTLETAKGRYRGTLREVCAKQASLQGSRASIVVPFGEADFVRVCVDDIEFDSDEIEVAVKTVREEAVAAAGVLALLFT